jgi:rfaE bifunctional protein nucleotidyltransferase chain/domain
MSQYFLQITNKIQDWSSAEQTIKEWQADGDEVVFTNGCFDLIHYGHLAYLAEAASLGKKLVIGLNSAASISRLKGENRPIKDSLSRLHLMASLQFVDLVVAFEQDTPLELIKKLQPNILVKGGDWKAEEIVGSKQVIANGGRVQSLAFVEGYSTTIIEQKIKNQ